MNRETKTQTQIEDRADIQVGHPLPRDTIRETTTGYLATCNQHSCEWQGLFPTAEIALTAAENHWEHARRNAEYHYEAPSHTIVELINDTTARVLDESDINPLDPSKSKYISATVNPTFSRTTGDLAAIVSTGTLIERPARKGKVWRVTETRSLGLPTWSITYVEQGDDFPDPKNEGEYGDRYWLNEMIMVDGTPTRRWHGQEYPVVGQADKFQATIGGFTANTAGERP